MVSSLSGRHVLLVEDEFFVAQMIEAMLDELGCLLVASIPRVDQALAMLDGIDADLAVLDVNVAGQEVFPVAERLAERGVPFVFSTGYGVEGLPARWRGRPMVEKPYTYEALEAALQRALAV